MVIDFSGTAGQIHTAFHTEIHNLLVDGVAHFANISDPEIPAALAPAVAGIVSLHDFRPAPMLVHHDFSSDSAPLSASGSYYLTPGDIATIYNFKPLFTRNLNGRGQSIYVIEDTPVYNINDWYNFRQGFGIPNTSYNGVNLDFVYPGPPSGPDNCTLPAANGNDNEATLDAEYASAAAPGAEIVMAICGDSGATSGVLIALQNLINGSNPPAIISVSYGTCEALNGYAMNSAFYIAYSTAVAEGVSIYVSAGDQGAAGCTRGNPATQAANTPIYGLGVNGWASTPFNVAVGGTDFQDTYLGENSTYWNASNATDNSSAKSYIPEIPWDTTCASQDFATFKGTGDIIDFCNGVGNPFVGSNPFYLNNWAGSGGTSTCAQGTPSVYGVVGGSCSGWLKPSWQNLVGVPADSLRDLPDVSMFASFGPWLHSYIICFSDTSRGGKACTGAPTSWNTGYGGTSFGAPIWAGIQALINQQTGERWGNPNYRLYQIAAAEYADAGRRSSCNSNGTPQASCIFYDVTVGDSAVPCKADGGAFYNCYNRSSGNTYGVLSSSSSSYQPAFFADDGWDFATGIGTVNVANLVAAWSPKTGTHDFSGEGVSDILWRQSGSGNLAMWLISNGQFSSGANISQVPGIWSVAGTRDFNGDGKADILWRDSSGNLAVWLMNGATVSSGIGLGNVGTQWQVAGTADFNADGTGDILWRNSSTGELATWLMSNGAFSSGINLGAVPLTWQIVGAADFNGDGTADILWRNQSTGDVAIWFLKNGQFSSGAGLGTVPLSWSVVGTGDFNGDATSDILWRDTSGNLAVWLISNGAFSSGAAIAQVPVTWAVSETGDFDGDGRSDILWLDSSGNLALWLMNGTTVSAYNGLGNVGTGWQVQATNAD